MHLYVHSSTIYNANTWKQSKCLLTNKWIKMWYIYNGILLGNKKNKIMPFAVTWVDLEIIILNDLSQGQKDKYHKILLTCEILKKW